MSYERAVRSWAGHLRSGGTSTWREWLAGEGSRPDVDAGDLPRGRTLPGAAQLELVRRAGVQAARQADGAGLALTALADLVLSRSGPGRGLAQQPLVWPRTDTHGDTPHTGFGAPAVDPSTLPVAELLRVGVGVLTELLLQAPPVQPPAPRPRPLLTRTPAFVLAGAPVTTSVVRRELALAGHVEGGFGPLVLLLAEPLELALAQAWSARVQAGAPVRWHGFLRRWTGRRELPPGVDLTAQARGWEERVGPGRVRVVAVGTGAAAQAVADVLGVGLRARSRPEQTPVGPVDLPPAAVDVARRVNAVLAVRVTEQRHAALLPGLARLLDATGEAAGHALGVPEPFRDWVRARAEQQAEELTAGRYPVLGSLGVPSTPGVLTHPRREDALTVLVAACLRHIGAPYPATEGAVQR